MIRVRSNSFYSLFIAIAATLALTACNGSDGAQDSAALGTYSSPNQQGRTPHTYTKDALVFTGSGTWASEVSGIESILSSNGASYEEASSSQLNAMSVDDIAKFGTIIWPGGYASTEADSLDAQTKLNIRAAVQDRGVGWVGFCAGAFIAGEPDPSIDATLKFGIDLVSATMPYYYDKAGGAEIQSVGTTFADGTQRNMLYYGGPITPGGAGIVVAKYANGDPEISQIWSGSGLVILSGTHPTVGTGVCQSLGVDSSACGNQDIAWKLFNAAIHQQPLPAF